MIDTTWPGVTFDRWMGRANRDCINLCGLTLDDLPDGNSWDAWNAGVRPRDYVLELLVKEGWS